MVEPEEPSPPLPPRQQGAWWAGWTFGSGYGWHGSQDLESRSELKVGGSFGPGTVGHFGPEVGVPAIGPPGPVAADPTPGHPAQGVRPHARRGVQAVGAHRPGPGHVSLPARARAVLLRRGGRRRAAASASASTPSPAGICPAATRSGVVPSCWARWPGWSCPCSSACPWWASSARWWGLPTWPPWPTSTSACSSISDRWKRGGRGVTQPLPVQELQPLQLGANGRQVMFETFRCVGPPARSLASSAALRSSSRISSRLLSTTAMNRFTTTNTAMTTKLP